MSNHTKGPWRVERQNPSPSTGEWMIAGEIPGYLAEVRDCGSGNFEANARLIAAAPELLEALENVIDRFMPCRDDYIFSKRAALDKAAAAIAKAKGEQ